MPDPNEMICAIYTDAATGEDRPDLVDTIARLLSGTVNPRIHYSITVPRSWSHAPDRGLDSYVLVDVDKNSDFNAELRSQFPDGFLHFRYRVEVYTESDKPDGEVKQIVERILKHLWSMGYPAVAACDFEEELPNKGGYKSRLIPWPAEGVPNQTGF